MSKGKSRFDLFDNFKKVKNKIKSDGVNSSGFSSLESIIPENSPLKNNSNSNSGFYNSDLIGHDEFDYQDEFTYQDDDYKFKSPHSNFDDDGIERQYVEDLDGVDEKYAKYIFSDSPAKSKDNLKRKSWSDFEEFNEFNDNVKDYDLRNYDLNDYNVKDETSNLDFLENFKLDLKSFRKKLLNKDKSSKTLFGKVTFVLIAIVLLSSIFYFFVYQPFQNELNLERNSKLNEIHTLYKGPLEINDNRYTLENQVNRANDIDEIKSIDVIGSATKDWRFYHSSKIVSSKDDFARVMMSYGDNKNIIMSVKDANDFVGDNDARILSNINFNKVNTVIVPISLSRLQATAGLISVGSVVDIYSLNDTSSDFDDMDSQSDSIQQSNENLENNTPEYGDNGDNGEFNEDSADIEGDSSIDNYGEAYCETSSQSQDEPVVSGATVLAILRSKDSGLVDSTISRSNNLIKGNETKPFENSSTYSADVEELLKSAVLNSNPNNDALDSYLNSYGVRLSNFERMSNLGDLDSEYIVLLEVPQSDVNFLINNMDDLVLTIPTEFAPNWVLGELNSTYYENLYQNQSYDFL